MFNAERLLGKLVQEVIGGRGGKNSLLGSLGSGGGLMTAIGLGVGAFEVLKDKNRQPVPPPPPNPAPHRSSPPPPPPQPPTTGPPPVNPPPVEPATNNIAIKMIQVVIAAGHADGKLDEDEKKAIFAKLNKVGLSEQEKDFLNSELYKPKAIADLTRDIDNPAIARAMYQLATQCVIIDTPEERRWFDELAQALCLDTSEQSAIENKA